MSEDEELWWKARQSLAYFEMFNIIRIRAIAPCIFCGTPTDERLATQKRGDSHNVQQIPCCKTCTIETYQRIAQKANDTHAARWKTHQALVTKARKILRDKENKQ